MSLGIAALKVLRLLLRPVARFCVKHSIKIQDLVECLKVELVSAAEGELAANSTKTTQSKLSVLTGLRRREITRLLEGGARLEESRSLVSKVVGRWQDDPAFCTQEKLPRVLVVSEDFSNLVRSVSQDLNPATVLFELKRVGAVTETAKGVKLKFENYIPKGDSFESYQILSRDLHDLICAVNANVSQSPALPNHHLRTEYDRVRPEGIKVLQQWLLREGHAFHLRAREEFAKFDQDINPDPNYRGPTCRAVLGSFGLVQEKSVPGKKE